MPANYKFFNRELSWIEFNARVLNEACRKEVPLLERLAFLGITSTNFEEFFQVRVASIKRQKEEDPHFIDSSGLTPSQLLKQISKRCHEIVKLQYETLCNDILPKLASKGIAYIPPEKLSAEQKSFTQNYFLHDISPVLTPQRADGIVFPSIRGGSLYAAFILVPMPGIHLKQTPLSAAIDSDYTLALVQIPSNLPRIIQLPEASSPTQKQFATLDDIIALYGRELFPGYNAKETLLFKVDRDADLAVDEDATSNYIQAMEKVLEKRQNSFAVRMVCNSTSAKIRSIIQEKLNLPDDDVYQVDGLFDPETLMQITPLAEGLPTAKELTYPEWKHFFPQDLPEEDTFWNTFRQHDVLLNVPYQSYDPVVKFIRDAAKDPGVLAIKITLYRTGNDSPIISALEAAAQSGKAVTAFVELKARFDEQRNITWASQLEKAGVTVIYGVVNLKVHAKICLVIRRESDGIRRYIHLSTGNYNPKTACHYQDFSIFTSNYDIANDATLFFNVISGYSAIQPMHHLFMAPVTLKSRLIEMIDREIRQSTHDSPGLIVAKMNSLCHTQIIEKLYQASQAGVKIMLNVRGICTLIPGVEGMSKNISVVSIVDRNLEHSRAFYFQNGGNEELYLSSADWMDRNLDRRIELMFPVRDQEVFKQLKDMLFLYFRDNTHSLTLQSDGSWKEKSPSAREAAIRVQEEFHTRYKRLAEQVKSPKTEFIIRRKD